MHSDDTALAPGPQCVVPVSSVEQLRRPFEMIAFDWDGTAVMSRQEDATTVRLLLERLLQQGVFIVVITGTNFQNVDRQLSSHISGPHKQRLFVCTNRGSEVYGFDARSQPVLVWKRTATPEENRLLTEIADAVRSDVVRRTGLDIRVVYNRLNRRKIDVIPEPAWANPPKSAIGDLQKAVAERLTVGGIPGGLRDVFDLAEAVARQKGLVNARVTSDVKHVEVGLTDKGDSIDWAMRQVADVHAIPAPDVLIAGDEFGPIAGFEGSDARMIVPAARGAVFVSVGAEPNGVPPGVIYLGGGPACFRTLLEHQIALHERAADRSPPRDHSRVGQATAPADSIASHTAPAAGAPDPSWVIVEDGFNPAREREVESLLTVANGYVGTRGSVHEHSVVSQPATFVAGVYTHRTEPIPQYVIAPDWNRFRVEVGGEEVRMDRGQTLDHVRTLDLRRGIFEHHWRFQDRTGRITQLRTVRFTSLANRHALVEFLLVTAENYSGRVVVESIVDGRATNAPVGTAGDAIPDVSASARLRSKDPAVAPRVPILVTEEVSDTGMLVILAAASRLRCNREPVTSERTLLRHERWVAERWEFEAIIGITCRVDKLVSLFTLRDAPDPKHRASETLGHLLERGADALLEEHTDAWAGRWATADVEITGDVDSQRAVRFGLYHLIASANPEDERVSIGARGLTGDSYKGHVFWDTEIYMLPFFTFSHPPSARAVLLYRYHTLPGARQKARQMGYRGALYPWESTVDGQEATPSFALLPDGEVIRILTAEQEHHISADVAYAVWQYWRVTGDDSFFLEAGAEIILETARFWASRVRPGDDGLYHIERVIGPDEYHETVDDNAYTNGLARWNLERGLDAARCLRERWPDRWQVLTDRLEVTDDELGRWRDIVQSIYLGFHPSTGLFEQFRGYFDLEDVDLAAFEPRTAPIDVILGRERVARTQIIKQPDVLMLIYLLWNQFPPSVREANFRYYAPRCAHGSSLSPSIHALLAARLGDVRLAERYFRQAAQIDLANNMGNASGGVHVAAQGGLWQATVFGAAGMQVMDDGLAFDPHLLSNWQRLAFPVRWRGRLLRIQASAKPRAVDVRLELGAPMTIRPGEAGPSQVIATGQRYRSEQANRGWSPWTETPR